MAAQRDLQSQELNALFESLGELDEEGKQWKELYQMVSEWFCGGLCGLLWHPMEFHCYGSEAEGLKCYFSDDTGDVDFMILQNTENCVVYEEMLEYLPKNPMHVRIKGANHPLFKSCLVEDTGYLATSALKNFHPAIFSECPLKPILAMKYISKFVDPRFHQVFVTNDITSPAVTMHSGTSLFGSFSGMLEAYRGPNILPHFDLAALEMFAIVMCKALWEIDYTRQLAHLWNDFCRFLKKSEISLVSKTSPTTLCQDTGNWLSDLGMQFLPILEEISNQLENSSRPQTYLEMPQHNSKDPCFKKEESRNESKHSPRTSVADPLDSEKKSKQASECSEEEYIGDQNDENGTRNQTDSQNLWSELREDSELSTVTGVLPFQSVYSSDEDHQRQPPIDDVMQSVQLLDLCFGTAPELREAPSKQKKFRDVEEAKPYDRVAAIDFVPAFKARGWPKAATEWIKRERKWPSPDIVDKVIQEGFHLVVKPPKNGNPECDFRISFSHAEYLLSQEMNDIQRECYRCLKKCHHACLSTQPESLATFHLKTILLQTIEETGAEMWTESSRAECMMKLLGNLIKALREKHLPHFFVRSCNLFSKDYMDNSELLETLPVKVEQIMERPIEFANNLIKDQKDAKLSRRGWHEQLCQGNLSGSELNESVKASALHQEAHGTQIPSENNSVIQTEQEISMITVPVLPNTEVGGCTDSYLNYYDLKDIYLDICKGLTDLALSNNSLETLGDIERKLVESLREYAVRYEVDDEQFSQLFETGWNNIYISIWLSNEGLNISHMMNEIQSLVKLWRDPNVEAESEPADPFDLDALIFSGVVSTMLRRIARNIEPGMPPQD